MIRKILAALAVPAAAAAITLGGTAASADANSIVGDPGVYLNSTHTLTLAAPNVVTAGKAAVLKKCNGTGDCSVFANLRGTETFDFVANTTKVFAPNTIPTGFEMRLHGTNWCVTNRGSAVTFEQCGNFASQNWNGSVAANTTASTGVLVLNNQKTGLNLGPTAVQAFAVLQASPVHVHWGIAS
jgi:hypothetical protein